MENKPKFDLKYTNQDYSTILAEMVSILSGGSEEALSTLWDNISSADPLFHLVHLFAAHKDIENHMIDYRLNESFVSTANEWASLVRKAEEIGYKIPSYRAGSAEYTCDVDSILENYSITEVDITIPNFSQFTDELGRVYLYISEDGSDFVLNSFGDSGTTFTLRLYQGSRVEQLIGVKAVADDNTYVLSNTSISIGSSYSSTKAMSRLFLGDVEYKEVPSLLEYSGADINVYEINVDPQGITYIKFHNMVAPNKLLPGEAFNLTYVVTQGQGTYFVNSLTSGEIELKETGGNVINENLVFTLQQGTIFDGLNMDDADTIRKNIAYFTRMSTLRNVEEIYNYITVIQRANPNIKKATVFDKNRSYHQGDLTEPAKFYDNDSNDIDIDIAVVLLDENNNLVDGSDSFGLVEDIQNKLMVPQELFVNPSIYDGGEIPAGRLDITVELTTASVISPGLISATKVAIYNAIKAMEPATEITRGYIRDYLGAQQLPSSVYNGNIEFVIKGSGGSPQLSIKPGINQIINIENKDTDITVIN